MKTSSDIVHYPSRQAYLDGRSVSSAKEASSRGSESAKKSAARSAKKDKPSSSVEKKAKPEGQKSKPKSEGKKAADKRPAANQADDVGEASENLGQQAIEQAKETATTTPLKVAARQLSNVLGGALSIPTQNGEKASAETGDIKDLKEKFEKSGAKVFFIRGFDWWGMGNDGGLKKMADELPASSYHSWKEEEQILSEIKNLKSEQPVVLVGHSLGGDTAVKIAEKLNNLKSGYRNIDLLVTMDSVGFDNDIIPQNVKKNMNFIAENDGLLNDGPNMARNQKATKVINELRDEGHLGVDDSPELKRKIFDGVHKLVDSRVQGLLERAETNGNPG